MNKITEIAKMIDHSILQPTYTDADLKKNCEIAKKYNVASVCVKPYAVKAAVELLKGSDVLTGCVIGFPHGNSSIEVKEFEAKQACKDGAAEIDMVVNVGKVLSEDWSYVEKEIKTITDACHTNKAIVKVIFETDFLPDDKHKIKLCEICSKVKADFVKTSTGYGFVKGSDGKFSYTGANEHDIKLMRKHSAPEVQVKAAGGVRSLDDLLKFKEMGVTRVGATATEGMIEEAKKRF